MQKDFNKTTKAGRFFWLQLSLKLNQFGLGFSSIFGRSFVQIEISFLFLHVQFDFLGNKPSELEPYPTPSWFDSLIESWDNEEDEIYNTFGEEE